MRAPRLVPEDILVHMQAEPPGRVPGGIVDEVMRIIPAAGRDTHAACDGETPVLRAGVLILETAEALAETGIRPASFVVPVVGL